MGSVGRVTAHCTGSYVYRAYSLTREVDETVASVDDDDDDVVTTSGFAGGVQLIECDVLVPAGQALRPHVRHTTTSRTTHYDLTYDTLRHTTT